jgi:hypothetical protein
MHRRPVRPGFGADGSADPLDHKATHKMLLTSMTRLPFSMAIVSAASLFVLGCNSASSRAPKDKFELKQTKKGQIVRLNKETGELDIVEAGGAAPNRITTPTTSTSKRAATSAPSGGITITKHPQPAVGMAEAPVSASTPGWASTSAPSQRLMVMNGAPIFVTARRTPSPLRIASNGSVFRLLGVERDWYRVEFDDAVAASRVGFVEKKYVIVKPIEAADLAPVDLSIRDADSNILEPVDLSIRKPK